MADRTCWRCIIGLRPTNTARIETQGVFKIKPSPFRRAGILRNNIQPLCEFLWDKGTEIGHSLANLYYLGMDSQNIVTLLDMIGLSNFTDKRLKVMPIPINSHTPPRLAPPHTSPQFRPQFRFMLLRVLSLWMFMCFKFLLRNLFNDASKKQIK